MHRAIATAAVAFYCFAMIGLIGGLGVMASGAGASAPKDDMGVGLALIMLLRY
ncbi:MAG: hypothetical protein MEP57_04105 [Microvirga sp.]|nr:hypothetical protein [Microvirga sp.]